MNFDTHKNLAKSNLAVVPGDSLAGTQFEVLPGDGDLFAVNMPVTLSPAGIEPDSDNSEIGYISAITGDTMTILRAQESTTARSYSTANARQY